MKKAKIGFIGGGNMAGSLIKGLIADSYPADDIWVSDPDESKLKAYRDQLGVNATIDNDELVNEVSVVVLAVKPQILKPVSMGIKEAVKKSAPLVVSIAAGIRSKDIANWLGGDVAIVRCMPNTPALVGSGATGLYANEQVSAEQNDQAESIMRSVGLIVWLDDEQLLDAVTAVSGSGPAYYFLMMEAMEKVAVEMGISQESARLLVQQTAFGAAKLAMEASDSPETLRVKVTSPGGTTERAISSFEGDDFRKIVRSALVAAQNRSAELSDELGG
ncbi:MAG: pyrroline-5-carboxylate reductase [Gammaproteobacteria bacterium]|nr:MAG: pyrroline-5-carboxylate reductase [Gammaproteobacteria bacterium]RLA24575.1 MAG: pyrroline-5-carboxylate reductase [Gammaproteobacteria bacterium]